MPVLSQDSQVETDKTEENNEVKEPSEVNDEIKAEEFKTYKKEKRQKKETVEQEVLKGHVSKVPSGTKLKIIVESPIFEETSKAGDEFAAKIAEDIVIDKNVVIPTASTVTGKITEINLARRLHKAGTVGIEFNNLTTPDGRQIPIVATVLTRSGLLKGRYNAKRGLIAGATILTPVAAGLGAGLAAEGSAVGAGIGAVLGAIAGLGLFTFQKGNKVDIKAGDELKIELTEDALVPQEASIEDQPGGLKEESELQEKGQDFTEKDFTEETEDSKSESKENESKQNGF